jgi:threonine dehydratase
LRAGRIIPQTDPHTIADGCALSLGEKTFAVLSTRVDQESKRHRSSHRAGDAAPLGQAQDDRRAVVRSAARHVAGNARFRWTSCAVGVILSGGNVDLDRLPWQA